MPEKCSRRRYSSSLVQVFTLSVYGCFLTPITIAQHNSNNGNAAAFDKDASPRTGYQITPTIAAGAQLETRLRDEVGFESVDGHFRFFESKVRTSLSYTPVSSVNTFLELDVKRKFEVSTDGRGSDPDWRLNLQRAYITLDQFIGGSEMTLGRQLIEDERAWLIKDELDGGVLFLAKNPFEFEITAAKKDSFRRNLLESNDRKGETVYLVEANYRFFNLQRIVGTYFLELDDAREGLEDISFVGLRSIGELNEHARYWFDAARVRGSRQGIDIRGYGFDFGSTYTFDVAGKPAVTAGLAFGSGDDNPDDGVDRAFRQTGLQKNRARFGGLPKVKYYGAALDPELSNLLLATAAVGLRPTTRSSVELVYHYYRQHKAANQLRDASIGRKPDGSNKELGSGLDFIFGLKFLKDWLLEGTASAFFTGEAFGNENDPIYVLEFNFKYLL